MTGRPRKQTPRYDADGVPVDPLDWDYEDWRILWEGYKAIKAAIAARRRAKAEASETEEPGALNVDH